MKKFGLFLAYLLLLFIGIISFLAFGVGGVVVYLLIISGAYFIFFN